MTGNSNDSVEHQEALHQLSQYLSDNIAPMIFAESVDTLFGMSPELIASQIVAWVASIHNTNADLATADYIFHAAKKLHLLGELELLPQEQVAQLLEILRPYLLQACPEQDRAGLSNDFDNLHLSQGAESGGSVEYVHRAGGQDVARGPSTRPAEATGKAAAAGQQAATDGLLQGLGQVNQMLNRLSAARGAPASQLDGEQAAAGGVVVQPGEQTMVARIVTEAAEHATSPTELNGSFVELRNQGLQISPDTIVRLLARNLPDWAPPPVASPEAQEPQGAVRAMRQMINMSKSSNERSQRFMDLVGSAVDEFNEGSLGRAVTMVDLAERMAESNEVDAATVTAAHRRAYDEIDDQALRQYVEDEDKHHLLRRVMNFFPHFAPKELFTELEMTNSRERRRFLLMVLNALGETTREAALEALEEEIAGEVSHPWYFKRNLVYLLRTTRRSADEPVDREIDALVHMSDPGGALQLVRETLATLGQIDHERAINALVARVSELEDGLTGTSMLPHDDDEIRSLLDSVTTMLARSDSRAARRCVVTHGLKKDPQLGDTTVRLAKLSTRDLSDDKPAVDRLVRALRAELPTKVLGLTVVSGKKAKGVERMIKALSGTDSPAVRKVLKEITENFAGQDFADVAARSLSQLGATSHEDESPSAALTGDLELFGLPSLLQNLSDSQLSGTLNVLDSSGQIVATVKLAAGYMVSADVGPLSGESGIYQLLERPVTGRFIFVREESTEHADGSLPGAKPVAPMLFEGIRRYDEFMRAASLVPDSARFTTTGQKPTNVDDEPNTDLVKDVWQRAVRGETPNSVEAATPVDSYRVRRLFEHWVTEGSLAPRDGQDDHVQPTAAT